MTVKSDKSIIQKIIKTLTDFKAPFMGFLEWLEQFPAHGSLNFFYGLEASKRTKHAEFARASTRHDDTNNCISFAQLQSLLIQGIAL